jgi:hypothetical protein
MQPKFYLCNQTFWCANAFACVVLPYVLPKVLFDFEKSNFDPWTWYYLEGLDCEEIDTWSEAVTR